MSELASQLVRNAEERDIKARSLRRCAGELIAVLAVQDEESCAQVDTDRLLVLLQELAKHRADLRALRGEHRRLGALAAQN